MRESLARALEAWASLRSACVRDDADGTTLLEGPGGRRAPVWPYSQALAAAVDLAMMTDGVTDAEGFVAGLEPYRRGDGYSPKPGQRRRYYDDNAWIGLALMQLYLQTKDDRYLEHARRVFGFVAEGQDPDGGVRWVEGRRSRNTCSTAPAAQLALRLHLVDGDEGGLVFAQSALAWLDRTLLLPGGLFVDHVDRHGVDRTLWTYNQGAAAGAHHLLYRATNQAAALERAMRTATSSLRRFNPDRTWRHPPVFNAVWFRNLLAIDSVERVPGLDEALGAYLDRAWTTGRDPDTGLFTADGIGSYDGTPAIDQAGLLQLFALRASPRERLADVT